MKLKGLHFVDGAEIQEAVTDELKKVQKVELLAAFRKLWSTQWRSWLRQCATSRKFAGSIPDGVIGFFSLT
jgi:hypothetical protein